MLSPGPAGAHFPLLTPGYLNESIYGLLEMCFSLTFF